MVGGQGQKSKASCGCVSGAAPSPTVLKTVKKVSATKNVTQEWRRRNSDVSSLCSSHLSRNSLVHEGTPRKSGSQLTIRNCSFYNNRAGTQGGAIEVKGDLVRSKRLNIIDSMFQNNTAEDKGGALFTGSKMTLEISNTIFTDNVARGAGGGAMWMTSETRAVIAASSFERNIAAAGKGGALAATGGAVSVENGACVSAENDAFVLTAIHLIATNLTENYAATNGGAVRVEGQAATLYPRGATYFLRNVARENGGAVSVDQSSSLKTNEGALVFAQNKARNGGAVSAENDAFVLMSAGCQTITFQMNWASSLSLAWAEDTNSAIVRRVWSSDAMPTTTEPNTMPASAADFIDDRGEWTILAPSSTEDTAVSFCLAVGEYEIVGVDGAYCFEGWGDGFVQVVDIANNELVAEFTVPAFAGCTSTTVFNVTRDPALTQDGGSVRFEDNQATGSGGAISVDESTTADLDRIDFLRNSAAEGGAVFVGVLATVSLSRATMRDNVAIGDGGAMSVGAIASVSVAETTATTNSAGGSGGMLHLKGINAAALRRIYAAGNHAGKTGGAIAVVDSTRTEVTLSNSTLRRNQASRDGGGALFADGAKLDVIGVQHLANSADGGNGGAVLTRENGGSVSFSDTECVDVDILLDWSSAGNGCPVIADGQGYTCKPWAGAYQFTCTEMQDAFDNAVLAGSLSRADYPANACSGCDCNFE